MAIQSTLYLLLVFNRPFPATLSLFFIVLRYTNNRKILFIKLSITGFELGSSGSESDCSANCATTTATKFLSYRVIFSALSSCTQLDSCFPSMGFEPGLAPAYSSLKLGSGS